MRFGSELRFTRRRLLGYAGIGGAAVAAGAGTAVYLHASQPRSRVSIFRAPSYSTGLEEIIRRGLEQYPDVVRRARSGPVVLKPNLVEHRADHPVNTHPAVIAAAVAAFRGVGAKHVLVAEGPGHCRDTEMLLETSGLDYALRHHGVEFVDLNLDDTRAIPLRQDYTRLGQLHLAKTAAAAALLVSLPKMKTHHWAGVTLSMKNLFGCVPGAAYGWPKNILHWRGIDNSIFDINAALRPGFAIVDGIEGMEGDGPLRGSAVPSGVLIMGDKLSAVDATATRIMGLYPERVEHLRMTVGHGGTISESRIDQIGEAVAGVRRSFEVEPQFRFLTHPPVLGGIFA